MATKISYGESIETSRAIWPFVEAQAGTAGSRRICDVGGGANPLLPVEYVRQHALDYVVLDISGEELKKADPAYQTTTADIGSGDFTPPPRPFDLVFSRMLAEHVKSGEQLHRNVFALLKEGGLAVHFFPTLYTLPFVANLVIPERLADALLALVYPSRNRYQHAKFPAYYSWCRGPSQRQFSKFESLGYEIVEYRGYFGHAPYYAKLGPLCKLHEMKTSFLLKHPTPLLTSYAMLVLRKPLRAGGAAG